MYSRQLRHRRLRGRLLIQYTHVRDRTSLEAIMKMFLHCPNQIMTRHYSFTTVEIPIPKFTETFELQTFVNPRLIRPDLIMFLEDIYFYLY